MGVSTRKKTTPRIMRLEMYESTSASFIHNFRGTVRRRGTINPHRISAEPAALRTYAAVVNFPRYNHQRLSSTKTPPTTSPNSFSARKRFILARYKSLLRRCLLCELTGNPVIGDVQPVFERNRRLPFQHFTQSSVVAVATSDSLRLG